MLRIHMNVSTHNAVYLNIYNFEQLSLRHYFFIFEQNIILPHFQIHGEMHIF